MDPEPQVRFICLCNLLDIHMSTPVKRHAICFKSCMELLHYYSTLQMCSRFLCCLA